MSAKWSKTPAGRRWHREYMREYMKRRRSKGNTPALHVVTADEPAAAVASVEVSRPARSLLSIVKREPEDVWPGNEAVAKPAGSIMEEYRQRIAKPKEQKAMFTEDQIIR